MSADQTPAFAAGVKRADYAKLEEDPESLERFEQGRRSKFRVPRVRKIATEVAGRVPDDDFCVALAGATKVFVAELVQEAKGDSTEALTPSDIRRAFARMQADGRVPRSDE